MLDKYLGAQTRPTLYPNEREDIAPIEILAMFVGYTNRYCFNE